MTSVVRTVGLTKYFGAQRAVEDLDLEIQEGQVFGFLGLNGAGKTTTMRMLLGLVRPTSGTAEVCGHAPGDPRSLARVGALVESPAFYPHMTGRGNLTALAKACGVEAPRVDAVLEQVGLAARADSRFRGYSLGMKQRLGVAAALLKEPDLLILDEPTNGLDPQAMLEMRELIRSLGTGQRTVMLSSHLLGEVEQVCDRVAVIHEGSLIAQGSVAELRSQVEAGGVLVRAAPIDEAHRAALALPEVEAVRVEGDALHITVDPAKSGDVNAALVRAGVVVTELRPVERSLEEIFMGLTQEPAEVGQIVATGEAP